VADALAWGNTFNPHDDGTLAGLYGLSWLLVHWLNNTHPDDFARYETLLVKGIDPDKAWKATFPALVPGDLDQQLNHFSRYGEYRYVNLPIPPVDDSVRLRPMTSAEVHAARAETALVAALGGGSGYVTEARNELSAALADDPGNVRALRMKLRFVKPEERVALGRRATAAHPEDGLAWLTLAETLRGAPGSWDEQTKAYEKAMLLLPDNPTAFNNLAWLYVEKGRAKDALPLALSAARLAPWDSGTLDTLAAALFGVGRCSEAVSIQRRALDLLPERVGPSVRADFAKRLAEFQQKCGLMSAPSSPASETAH
jgi:tetratricopeptide (TPR) repeat protein